MSLRPAARTLRSLTGIVIVAFALWALLNFVYAPSCGRFSCSYVPSWWPQAQADTMSACPDNVAGAASDAGWAADRYATIKDAKITTGLFYEPDGTEHRFESGRDADSERALAILHEIGVVQPPVRPNVVDHVEAKVAARMRAGNLSSGVLVINFPHGVCGTEEQQPFSCAAIVPAILPAGATLSVWSPREVNEGRPSVKLTGDAR